LNAALVVAATLAWTFCGGPENPPASHASFQNERANLRRRLSTQTGNASVQVDDNTILLGIVPNPYGKPNATRDPSEMHISRGKSATLTWVCWDGVFTLKFLPDAGQVSPLEKQQTDIVGDNGLPSVASAVVRGDAGPGRYSFGIHVDLADGGTYDDQACPPIIIDP
jgi:hypothetical protein